MPHSVCGIDRLTLTTTMEKSPLVDLLDTAALHLPAPPTERQMRLSAIASWWRAKFWGFMLSVLSDGVTTIPGGERDPVPLTRKPPIPDGPLIVVANHSSHADTAVLLATLGRTRPVKFVAAADYWLGSVLHKVPAKLLVGIWPIRRDRNGLKDMLAAASTVAAGTVLVVFPEGSRRRTTKLAGFKRGAFELSAAAGAQILPVGLVGTGDILPAEKKLIHRTPVEVRWGEPFTVKAGQVEEAATTAFEAIDKLIEAPAVQRPGGGWTRVRRIAFSMTGLAIITGWAYAEGVVWPLIAEMPLLLLVVTVGRSWRGPLLIAAAAVASALGILTTWWLVSHGVNTPMPLTTERMHDAALNQLATDPAHAFANQMFNGIPVKVYAHSAGELGMSFWDVVSSMLPRLARIGIVGGGGWLLGGVLARYLKPCLGAVQFVCLAMFPFGLGLIIWWWS